MNDPALVMPMAGLGSRFVRDGYSLPKPMIDLCGRPFFWWAAESVLQPLRAAGQVPRQIVAVVLKEHVERHGIDVALRASYPGIRIVVLESVTEGAAETARIGIEALSTDGPIAVQDCDHAFSCPEVPDIFRNLLGTHDAALVGFRAHKPHFSYVELDGSGTVIGTVEKQVVSPFAIAGCYFYSSSELFHKGLAIFRDRNPYNELFLSGVTDALAEQAPGRVGFTELETHFPFGTPEEMARFDPALAMRVLPWARDTLLGTSE